MVAVSSGLEQTLEAIRGFVAAAVRPAVVEPGDQPIDLKSGFYELQIENNRLMLQAWTRDRNLVRRITGLSSTDSGRLALEIERFGKRTGTIEIVDLARPANHHRSRRATRLEFRERFRRSILRQFPGWKLVSVSSDADLEHSFSPAYARGFLRQGSTGWAAIGVPPEQTEVDGVLTFGLLWLDYLRRRESHMAIQGLALFVPEGRQGNTCLRLLYLNPTAAEWRVFIYGSGFEDLLDLQNYGNVDTDLPPINAGLEQTRGDLRNTEARLESCVRNSIADIDASLLPAPVYGQVPAIAGMARGIIDLLACDFTGRLALVELKAVEDPQLPLQALDYWIRVNWHLNRDEFSTRGFFPGIMIRKQSPRMFLVAPSLNFHPSTEVILRYLSPEIEIYRIGVSMDWERNLKIVFRAKGSERPASH